MVVKGGISPKIKRAKTIGNIISNNITIPALFALTLAKPLKTKTNEKTPITPNNSQ